MKIPLNGEVVYIGSHVAVAHLLRGHKVIIINSLSNSKIQALERLHTICGAPPSFIKGNVHNQTL